MQITARLTEALPSEETWQNPARASETCFTLLSLLFLRFAHVDATDKAELLLHTHLPLQLISGIRKQDYVLRTILSPGKVPSNENPGRGAGRAPP